MDPDSYILDTSKPLRFIYLITSNYVTANIPKKKYYVGQSKKTIGRRFCAHKIDANQPLTRPQCRKLYNAMRKHGFDKFSVSLLLKCTVDDVDDWEIYYIKKYDSQKNGYNIHAGGKKHKSVPEETRELIGLSQRGKKKSVKRTSVNNTGLPEYIYTVYSNGDKSRPLGYAIIGHPKLVGMKQLRSTYHGMTLSDNLKSIKYKLWALERDLLLLEPVSIDNENKVKKDGLPYGVIKTNNGGYRVVIRGVPGERTFNDDIDEINKNNAIKHVNKLWIKLKEIQAQRLNDCRESINRKKKEFNMLI